MVKVNINPKTGFLLYESTKAAHESKDEPSHSHSCHEIFLMLEGELNYFSEGNVFPLKPQELVLICEGTIHGKNQIMTPHISFINLSIEHSFFVKNNCTQYEEIFLSEHNSERKINADICESSGLSDAFKRLKSYTHDFLDTSSPIASAIIMEILYIMNHRAQFSKSYITHSQVQQIFDYVNDNFTQKITLDDIAEKCFLSKYHVCKLFKKYAGNTVFGYITNKRIEKTKQLVAAGKNITSACTEAGFSDYSSFYKAFVKSNNSAPKDLLK